MAALVAFVVTLVTQACDLSVYDSAELALGALGPTLAHPPGQPLHTLLAWIFTHIPWVPRLWSITLASSVATVPLVVAASSWVFAMSEADAPPPAAGASAEGPSRGHRLALGLVCAALVLHAPVWEMLSRVEVYALATAGIAWALARALAIVGGYIEGGARGWASVGVALGLAACANPVMGAQGGVAVLPCVLLARREGRFGVREVAAAVMGGALPLVLYAWVPWIGAHAPDDVFVWGRPRDGASLWHYLSGADYQHNLRPDWTRRVANARMWLAHGAQEGTLWTWLVGLVATLAFARPSARPRARAAAFGALSLVATQLVFKWNDARYDPRVLDHVEYTNAATLALGAALVAQLTRMARDTTRRRVATAALLGLALALLLVEPGVLSRTRHRDTSLRAMASQVLAECEPGALLVVASDALVFPLLWLQEGERQRRDVVLVVEGFAASSWYLEHLARIHPDLRPYAIRGPGRREGRIGRMITANAERPLRFEDVAQAYRYSTGRAPCIDGWTVTVGPRCDHSMASGRSAQRVRAISAWLRDTSLVLGRGSPPSSALLAGVSLRLGLDLWRTGRAAEAGQVLVSALDDDDMPPALRRAWQGASLATAPPLPAAPIPWRDPAPLGDPGQNLHAAGVLAVSAGRDDLADILFAGALAHGIQESQPMLQRPRRRSP
jgi:hypothetical protein